MDDVRKVYLLINCLVLKGLRVFFISKAELFHSVSTYRLTFLKPNMKKLMMSGKQKKTIRKKKATTFQEFYCLVKEEGTKKMCATQYNFLPEED